MKFIFLSHLEKQTSTSAFHTNSGAGLKKHISLKRSQKLKISPPFALLSESWGSLSSSKVSTWPGLCCQHKRGHAWWAGEESQALSVPSTQSWKSWVSGWFPCWLLKLLWKFRIGPLPHSLLAGSLFFSRSFHRTVISPNSAFYLFIYFWPGCASCRISVFQPGIKSLPPARNRSVWTTGPQEKSLSYNSFLCLSRSFLPPLGTGAEPFENLSFLCDW